MIKCRDDHTNGEVVDKIHIFRPDRVFKVTIFFPWIGTPFFLWLLLFPSFPFCTIDTICQSFIKINNCHDSAVSARDTLPN